MNLEEWIELTKDYWTGAFDLIDDDAPDGAWFQMHLDCIDWHLETLKEEMIDIGLPPPPEGVDSHDIFMAYLQATE